MKNLLLDGSGGLTPVGEEVRILLLQSGRQLKRAQFVRTLILFLIFVSIGGGLLAYYCWVSASSWEDVLRINKPWISAVMFYLGSLSVYGGRNPRFMFGGFIPPASKDLMASLANRDYRDDFLTALVRRQDPYLKQIKHVIMNLTF